MDMNDFEITSYERDLIRQLMARVLSDMSYASGIGKFSGSAELSMDIETYQDYLKLFKKLPDPEDKDDTELDKWSKINLRGSGVFCTRIIHAFIRCNINTVYDLITKISNEKELYSIGGIGDRSVQEIMQFLKENNLKFRKR
jgi:DNA-directed RNA polymerase alpha subunit